MNPHFRSYFVPYHLYVSVFSVPLRQNYYCIKP